MADRHLKSYLKLNILLFGITFILTTCEKDNFHEEETLEATDGQRPISIKTIDITEAGETFDHLKDKLQLKNHLGIQHLGNTQQKNGTGTGHVHNIIIYTDEVREITQGDYTSYTMKIASLDDDPNTFYNITIEDKNGTEGMFVTQYKKESSRGSANGKRYSSISTQRVDDITEPLDKEVFGSGDPDGFVGGSGGGGGDSTEYPYDCEGIVIPTTVVVPYDCTCEGHMPWQVCDCASQPGWNNITTYECWETGIEEIDDPIIGGPYTVEPGGGNNGNIIGGSGDAQNPSLTSPLDQEVGTDSDPCARAKALEEDTFLADFYTAAEQFANNDNVDYEVGFTMKKQDDGSYSFISLSGTSENPYIAMQLEAGYKMDIFIHTHYKGLLSIFSVPDLQMYHTILNGYTANGTDLVFILITNAGTRYAITVNNAAKFNAVANLNFLDDGMFKEFIEDYFENVKKEYDNDINELNFLRGIKKADMGLSLFEANADYTEWKELTLDPNNETNIIKTDCN
ncbi:hypothetical protein [Winogradskyella luteola]|uniref:Uncharacterized protein n=1 Tax=Winogradskyella luteola TaxID=2828330 RepID=A0A9X1F5U3_9FLAO|nr:hypothetical protein [Winogradskyella luteola]MBV7267942.1 hypothetical protein [Winogradskyella luteola]